MAISEIYVDPSIAADSGAGTVGDPYGDLEYAIEQGTFDTTNGTRVNIKAGTDEILAADLITACSDTSVTIAWAPHEQRPLIFQGYTATAGDGGIGGISGGGGNFSIFGGSSGTFRNMRFHDLHLHNTGTADILDVDNYCTVSNCEINNTTGSGVFMGVSSTVFNCYFHDIGTYGVRAASFCGYSYFENGTKDFTSAIWAEDQTVYRNIISVDGGSNGILSGNFSKIINNSIYGGGSTGDGIADAANTVQEIIVNNLIEGFGVGINFATTQGVKVYGGNSAYDCTTEFDTPSVDGEYVIGTNEILTASPFNDAATGDFSPVDTGAVKEGAAPAAYINT